MSRFMGPRQSFFWYDPDFKIQSVNTADYKSIAKRIGGRGLLWYDKHLKVDFPLTWLICSFHLVTMIHDVTNTDLSPIFRAIAFKNV